MKIIIPTDTVYGDPRWLKQVEIKGLGVFEQGPIVTCGVSPDKHIVVGIEYRRLEKMTLAQLSHLLRDTSARYGGIQRYLEAAGAVDKAASEFFKAQDMDALSDLNAAVARAWACRKEMEGHLRVGS